ncbi:FtsX-like permease family protein [Kitasatospora sp. NPDC049258]|uniref:FtsX-like permease family protein n=1 Tax=Kitasatospora sp. NPDC049258 TaxID=3155394 RepID=UPI0034450C91
MKLTAWRASLRIARRDAQRAKGRSALVLAMIALPVLGVTGADVIYRSAELSATEQADRLMGRADALVILDQLGTTVLQEPDADQGRASAEVEKGKPPTPEQTRALAAAADPVALLKELLPAGTGLVPVVQGSGASATSKEGRVRAGTAEADLTDPIWHGRINLTAGRAPAAPQELAATQAFLDQAGLRIGDTTTLRGLESRPFTITAAVEYPGSLRSTDLVGRPGALVEPLRTAQAQQDDRYAPGLRWLVRLPAGGHVAWPKVLELNNYGLAATSRAVLADPPARSQVPYYVWNDQHGGGGGALDPTGLIIAGTVAGMALLEIVLLAGPAFAVGARRSRRQLGLLAAGGGDRSHIRAVVLGGGVVLGLAGALVGVVLAVGLVAATRPWLEEQGGTRFGHLNVQPLDLLGVAAIGLVTGLLAAVVPAVQASRQDVVEALTGRGSVKPANRKLALLGLVMVGGGAALALLGASTGVGGRATAVLGGSVLAELGMVALTPMLVGLFGRLGRHLPLAPRLALRDAVRHRGRTAPAVAAVMAAVAGSVAVGIYTASSDQQNRNEYRAMMPPGAVSIALGYGSESEPAELPKLRTAVEQAFPDLGRRADVSTAGYQGNCRVGVGGCGSIELAVPKERRCPATDPDNERADEPADPAAVRAMRADPRCAERGYAAGGAVFGELPVGDAAALHNLYGVDDPAAAQALAQGKAVVFDELYVKDGKITLDLTERSGPMESGPARTGLADGAKPKVSHVGLDAVVVKAQTPGRIFVGADTARRLGLDVAEVGSVWLPDTVPADSAEQKASAAVAKVSDGADLEVERGYRSVDTLVSLGLTGFAALVALGAAGIATGLAAADSQRDLATLAAVGAAGGIRRRLAGFQCGVIAAMGAVLGTLAGVVPAVALRKVEAAAGSDMTSLAAKHEAVIAFPWPNIAITLIGLPLLATGLAMLLTRSRLVLVRRSA